MSDEFDVSNLFPADDGQQGTPIETPQANPELDALKSQVAELSNQNKALAAWKEDAAKVFSGGGSGEPNYTEQHVQNIVDPNKFNEILDSRVNQKLGELELKNQYRNQNPDLAWAENYIINDARELAMRDAQLGAFKGDNHYVSEAIKQFRERSGHQGGSQNQAIKTMALDMGSGNSTPSTQKIDFMSMSNEDFEKLDQQIGQKLRNT